MILCAGAGAATMSKRKETNLINEQPDGAVKNGMLLSAYVLQADWRDFVGLTVY